MKPTISIIIPTYNRANLLEGLLQRLLAQSDQPDEIIVVDDHSTDNTSEIVSRYATQNDHLVYTLNDGKHLAAGRQTGLKMARSDYVGFIDDDVIIESNDFIKKLRTHLAPNILIQPKVVMENFGQTNVMSLSIWENIMPRPFPILELCTSSLNRGSRIRKVFPFNELGVFWHKSLNYTWHDPNLIGDAYGQSYDTALQLKELGQQVLFYPDLLLRHPGAATGGSKKFNKKLMTQDFTSFHYDYFYNMIYIHSRWLPGWVWLWLPFYTIKATVGLAINRNARGYYQFALKPIWRSFLDNFWYKRYAKK